VNTEKIFYFFLLGTSPAIAIDASLKIISPDFIANLLGTNIYYAWDIYIKACCALWVILILFIAIDFVYFSIIEKYFLKKNKITVNNDMEYVLPERHKNLILAKENFSISLIFNSNTTGIAEIRENDGIVKFNVKKDAEDNIEQELKDYFRKHFNRTIIVEASESETYGRWERTIIFN
jgi:hypothetical protein